MKMSPLKINSVCHYSLVIILGKEYYNYFIKNVATDIDIKMTFNLIIQHIKLQFLRII